LVALVCAALVTFWGAGVVAQSVSLPGDGERSLRENQPDQPNHARTSQVDGYRNGSEWIRVERTGPRVDGLTPVRLQGGGRTYDGQIDDHAIVQLAPDVDAAALLRSAQLQRVRPLSAAARLYLVAADSGEDGLQIAGRLASRAGVVEAVPDLHTRRARHAITIPPNDPHYGGQWYLKKVTIEKAWRLSTGSADTKIVVVDDGCDMQHPDLREKFVGGID
jgi:hypothetical protein